MASCWTWKRLERIVILFVVFLVISVGFHSLLWLLFAAWALTFAICRPSLDSRNLAEEVSCWCRSLWLISNGSCDESFPRLYRYMERFDWSNGASTHLNKGSIKNSGWSCKINGQDESKSYWKVFIYFGLKVWQLPGHNQAQVHAVVYLVHLHSPLLILSIIILFCRKVVRMRLDRAVYLLKNLNQDQQASNLSYYDYKFLF